MTELICMGNCIDNYDCFNEALGRKIGWVHCSELKADWGAFFKNPLAYKNTVVADMINQWADEKLAYLQSIDMSKVCNPYGAQSVMLDDIM